MGSHPEHLPRADLDVELFDVPGASVVDPLSRRERQTADCGDPERHTGDHPLAGGDPGEPSAGRRQRPGPPGTGALRRYGGTDTVIDIDIEELRTWFGFGVAGNFAGHLEQAGEA